MDAGLESDNSATCNEMPDSGKVFKSWKNHRGKVDGEFSN